MSGVENEKEKLSCKINESNSHLVHLFCLSFHFKFSFEWMYYIPADSQKVSKEQSFMWFENESCCSEFNFWC